MLMTSLMSWSRSGCLAVALAEMFLLGNDRMGARPMIRPVMERSLSHGVNANPGMLFKHGTSNPLWRNAAQTAPKPGYTRFFATEPSLRTRMLAPRLMTERAEYRGSALGAALFYQELPVDVSGYQECQE